MRVKNVIIFVVLVIITTAALYCLMPLSLDSVWNYGFGYNIFNGLVPYKDFNMVVTPFFPYLIALFLSLMGDNYIVYHILVSSLIVGATIFAFKKIGFKSLFVYFFLMIYPYNGYNLFGVFLVFSVLYLLDKDYKYNDFLIAGIVSLMFLSKQTLVLFIIPSVFYANKRRKIIAFYLVVLLAFLGYLIINNNLFQFIDYCFLGMFDFTSNTTKVSGLTIFEIALCLYLLWELVKSKFKNKEAFYILLCQVISFPITDGSHFVLTFTPIIYYLFIKYNKYKIFNFLFSLILVFYVLGAFSVLIDPLKYDRLYENKASVFNYKRMPTYMDNYFEVVDSFMKKYPDYRLYLLDSRAYLVKMDLGIEINKYDLINDGNMGYKGEIKYVEEIDDYCGKNKCLFIVNDEEVEQNVNQINEYITSYVVENYYKIYGSNLNSVYIN